MGDALSLPLGSRRARVEVAPSTDRALTLVDQGSAQVLIIDTALPDYQAYRLMEHIKALEKPVATLALTAAESAEDRRQALRAGFQVCLAKPIETAELAASLASLTGLLNA
ncbi:MAG: response regulator [Nodosilinea sp.]